MSVQKYSINNIFKLILIFGIILGTNNFVLANDNPSDTQKDPVEASEPANIENSPASEDNSAPQEPEDTNANSDDGNSDRGSDAEQQSQSSNNEVPASQELFTIKNILLLFAIIDLPIFALLLILWFLARKEQKQKFDHLINGQNKINRNLKHLETTILKLENLDNFQNKIAKDIKQNKQEIIDSQIKIFEAFEKKQSERPVNSNGNTSSGSNNCHNSSISTTELTEDRLEQHKYTPVAVKEQIPQFVDKYNLDKKSLSNEAKATVAATEASLNERRLGKSDILTLEHTTQKKYWIVQEDDYYLVPHAKIKIDEYNKTTLESLFECINFDSDYTDFYLIKPAKVSQLESELWQLEKKGKLEFS